MSSPTHSIRAYLVDLDFPSASRYIMVNLQQNGPGAYTLRHAEHWFKSGSVVRAEIISDQPRSSARSTYIVLHTHDLFGYHDDSGSPYFTGRAVVCRLSVKDQGRPVYMRGKDATVAVKLAKRCVVSALSLDINLSFDGSLIPDAELGYPNDEDDDQAPAPPCSERPQFWSYVFSHNDFHRANGDL